MKKCNFSILIILLSLCITFVGCSKNAVDNNQENRPPDIEPTAVYNWMAGESPVPSRRMDVSRYGVCNFPFAVSPQGTYFLNKSFIVYSDHGSDTFVPLCSRADCTHNNTDCNAYVYGCNVLTYHNSYLYVVSGFDSEEECELIRMAPDGSDHVSILDMLAFAKEHNGEFVRCDMLVEGYCIFSTYHWVTTYEDDFSYQRTGEYLESYMFKLDGSMEEPVVLAPKGGLYYCGDTLLCMTDEGLASGDLDEGTSTFLTEHPGYTGYYDDNYGYYFNAGNVIRYDYKTKKETVLIETNLVGRYLLFMFPDCMVLASREEEDPDPNLYIYNWNYELVDIVEITYEFDCRTQFLLIAETAEQFILTNTVDDDAKPQYYINKSELGTGNVEIHPYKWAECP